MQQSVPLFDVVKKDNLKVKKIWLKICFLIFLNTPLSSRCSIDRDVGREVRNVKGNINVANFKLAAAVLTSSCCAFAQYFGALKYTFRPTNQEVVWLVFTVSRSHPLRKYLWANRSLVTCYIDTSYSELATSPLATCKICERVRTLLDATSTLATYFDFFHPLTKEVLIT